MSTEDYKVFVKGQIEVVEKLIKIYVTNGWTAKSRYTELVKERDRLRDLVTKS